MCRANTTFLNDDGKQFLEPLRKRKQGSGWYSFEKKGVHFIGLVERAEFEGRWAGDAWARPIGVAGRRREAF